MQKWKRQKMNKDKYLQQAFAWKAHRLNLNPEIVKIVELVINRIWSASPPVVSDQHARVFAGLDKYINTGNQNE